MDDVKISVEAKESRLVELLQQPHVRGFLWGVGTAAVASYLWPRVRGSVRPAVVSAISEVMSLADNAMESAVHLKEELEDILAEARSRKEMPAPEAPELPGEDPTTGPASSGEIAGLKASVLQIQQRLNDVDQVRAEVAEIKRLLRQIAEQAAGQAEGQ